MLCFGVEEILDQTFLVDIKDQPLLVVAKVPAYVDWLPGVQPCPWSRRRGHLQPVKPSTLLFVLNSRFKNKISPLAMAVMADEEQWKCVALLAHNSLSQWKHLSHSEGAVSACCVIFKGLIPLRLLYLSFILYRLVQIFAEQEFWHIARSNYVDRVQTQRQSVLL